MQTYVFQTYHVTNTDCFIKSAQAHPPHETDAHAFNMCARIHAMIIIIDLRSHTAISFRTISVDE